MMTNPITPADRAAGVDGIVLCNRAYGTPDFLRDVARGHFTRGAKQCRAAVLAAAWLTRGMVTLAAAMRVVNLGVRGRALAARQVSVTRDANAREFLAALRYVQSDHCNAPLLMALVEADRGGPSTEEEVRRSAGIVANACAVATRNGSHREDE